MYGTGSTAKIIPRAEPQKRALAVGVCLGMDTDQENRFVTVRWEEVAKECNTKCADDV